MNKRAEKINYKKLIMILCWPLTTKIPTQLQPGQEKTWRSFAKMNILQTN
jgi:hypothetical protein